MELNVEGVSKTCKNGVKALENVSLYRERVHIAQKNSTFTFVPRSFRTRLESIPLPC